MPEGRGYLNLTALDILHEKRFARRVEDMQRATGLHYRDLWEFRQHAINCGTNRSGLFIWMLWNGEEARGYVTQKDEDQARKHWKAYEKESGFA